MPYSCWNFHKENQGLQCKNTNQTASNKHGNQWQAAWMICIYHPFFDIFCFICSMSLPTKIVPCRASAGASVHWLCDLSSLGSLSMSYHHLCSWHCWGHQPSPPLSHQRYSGLSAHLTLQLSWSGLTDLFVTTIHHISIKYSQKNYNYCITIYTTVPKYGKCAFNTSNNLSAFIFVDIAPTTWPRDSGSMLK